MSAQRVTLASAWLERLREIMVVPADEVFPSDQLLDHIPLLIDEIASYLRAPSDEEIAANTAVLDKARELGGLRRKQRASIHQLLREYEILGGILETFLIEETARLGLAPSSTECFDVLRRLTRSVAILMRTTVDTFISEYTSTIQEQNERLKAFNRAASHELRSPVGTIMFAAATLDKDHLRLSQDGKRLANIARIIRSNAERLSWLIENLQRIAKLTEPVDAPTEQLVDVESIALEVARQLEEMAAARQVQIRVGEGLPRVVADPARLELALLNLVSNGIKYSDPAKRPAYVAIEPVSDGDSLDVCTMAVRDNGIGIPDNDKPSVFERFYRAHSHLDGELGVSGIGLGLAIVADCVTALDGSIRCDSTMGAGTSFYITLPCRQTAVA